MREVGDASHPCIAVFEKSSYSLDQHVNGGTAQIFVIQSLHQPPVRILMLPLFITNVSWTLASNGIYVTILPFPEVICPFLPQLVNIISLFRDHESGEVGEDKEYFWNINAHWRAAMKPPWAIHCSLRTVEGKGVGVVEKVSVCSETSNLYVIYHKR